MRIEHAWVAPRARRDAPLIVFLHEGLGSLAMWRRLPAAPVRRRRRARPGLLAPRLRPLDAARAPTSAGASTSCTARRTRCCPRCSQRCGIDAARDRPGSSATATAARSRCCTRRAFPQRVAGVVVLAPHIFVEDLSVASIEQGARAPTWRTDLRQRLARYHDDPDSAFWGWNDIWLHPPFRDWNIEDEIAAHRLPAARDAGRRRRIRHARADPRHRARACRRRELLELPRLRPFAAPRPARARDRRGGALLAFARRMRPSPYTTADDRLTAGDNA